MSGIKKNNNNVIHDSMLLCLNNNVETFFFLNNLFYFSIAHLIEFVVSPSSRILLFSSISFLFNVMNILVLYASTCYFFI